MEEEIINRHTLVNCRDLQKNAAGSPSKLAQVKLFALYVCVSKSRMCRRGRMIDMSVQLSYTVANGMLCNNNMQESYWEGLYITSGMIYQSSWSHATLDVSRISIGS